MIFLFSKYFLILIGYKTLSVTDLGSIPHAKIILLEFDVIKYYKYSWKYTVSTIFYILKK
jgi:hypothetical protein